MIDATDDDNSCGGRSTSPTSKACQYCLFANTAPRRSRASALYAHHTDEWETPPSLLRMLNREFGFTLDVCATNENKKCQEYFSKEEDRLATEWRTNVCGMNPHQYSELHHWLTKAYESSLRGATVVCRPGRDKGHDRDEGQGPDGRREVALRAPRR